MFAKKNLPNTLAAALTAAAIGLAAPAFAKSVPMVGGAPMYPQKNIVQNAVNSKDHTTLVAAVKAAGLVDTLSGAGPVHGVRADQRGLRQAAGRHGRSLVKPENKGTLTKVLTYHVVARPL